MRHLHWSLRGSLHWSLHGILRGTRDMVTDETTQHEDCVAILKGRDWGWNDYHCDLHLQFVCGFCISQFS